MRKVLISLAVVSVILAGILSLVLFTSTGLNLVTRVVSYLSAGVVIVEDSGGRIVDRWWLRGVTIEAGGTRITFQEIDADWQLSQLFQKNVQADAILVKEMEVILPELDSGSEKKEPTQIELPTIGLPIAIIVDELKIEGGVVRRAGTAQTLFVLDSLFVKLRAQNDQLVIEEVALITPEFDTSFTGKLQFSQNWPLEIKGNWSADLENYTPANGTITLSENINNPEFEIVSLEPLAVNLGGKITTLFAEPAWQLRGDIQQLNPSSLQSALPDMEIRALIDSTGTVDDYHATISGSLEAGEYPRADIDLQISGNQHNLSLDSATIAADSSETRLTAMLDWQQNLSWEAQVKTTDFDLSTVISQPVGQVSFLAHSAGTYDDGKLLYDLSLEDLVAKTNQLNQDVLAAMTLQGSESGLTVVSSDISIAEGHIHITGWLEWLEGLSWDTSIVMQSIDPSVAMTAVEGSIHADIHSSGQVRESGIAGDVKIKRISGALAGYELTGSGMISYLDGDTHFKRISVKNGTNYLEIDGSIADTIDLMFSLDGSELSRLLPLLEGSVKADGVLTGTKEYPGLTATIDGSDLSYRDYSAGSVVADLVVSTEKNGTIDAAVTAQEVNIAEQRLNSVAVKLSGAVDDHNLDLTIDSTEGVVSLTTTGSLIENSMWDGQLKIFKLEHPRYGVWQNEAESSLQVSAKSVALGKLCVGSDGVSVCSSGSWGQDSDWSLDVSSLTFDLTALNRWELTDYRPVGIIHGAATISAAGSQLTSLNAELTLDKVELVIGENEYYEQLQWLDNSVSVHLDDTVLKTEIFSRFVDESFVKGTIGISTFGDLSAPFAALPLSAELTVAVKDLTPLKVVTGAYLEPAGYLSADLTIAGTIGDPRFAGDITLADGAIYIPQLNITPRDINISVSGSGDSLAVALDTVSGEGTATAEGTFQFDGEGWLGNLKILGNNVELIKQKEVEIIADADLLLKLGSDGGRLEGSIVIPEALIQPEEMTGSVSESDDVKVMGEEAETAGWPFALAVKIDLGDNVRVDGYGLSGNLMGSIGLANSERGFLTGHGELYLDKGMISVYDRQLEITRGRVLFDGGPVDNPGLDVSARKTIAAEEFGRDDIVVGVNLIGSVDDFEMDLFSIPSMDDADIISYIVVGTSMQSSGEGESGAVGAALSAIGMNQGNKILGTIGGAFAVDDFKLTGTGSSDTSLVVGKRLMDDLYISYDFNLYKNSGFFIIRYDFGKGFSVESKNSIESNGLNLLYSLER